jgi:hypothetical protein
MNIGGGFLLPEMSFYIHLERMGKPFYNVEIIECGGDNA